MNGAILTSTAFAAHNTSPAVQADILIVDDNVANLQVLSHMLSEQGYRTRQALSGATALRAAKNQPPDLILLDIMMPEMDGFEACRRLKADAKLRGIPVIFLSALAETEDKVKAFEVGGADYVVKPFQFDEVRARVETHLGLRRLQAEVERYNRELQTVVQEQVKEIADSQMATIFALAKLAESRDDETGRHLEHVQELCGLLAVRMREQGRNEELDDTYIGNVVHAAPLHDIGKVAIPDRILLKPDRLTPEEFEIMKTHTTLGAQTLEAVRREYSHNAFIDMGVHIARSHHERWDGGGYPDGLAGREIPLCARIMAVVDVYDAARSRRCYKEGLSHAEVCGIILGQGGRQFDPDAVEAFMELQDAFKAVWRELGVTAQPAGSVR
jgi:putative two-component system response regulator